MRLKCKLIFGVYAYLREPLQAVKFSLCMFNASVHKDLKIGN